MQKRNTKAHLRLFIISGCAIALVSAVFVAEAIISVPGPTSPRDYAHWALRGSNVSDETTGSLVPVADPQSKLPNVRAKRVQDAIKADDFAATDEIVAEVAAETAVKTWTLFPFDDFAKAVPDLVDPTFEGHLSKWVEQRPSDALPLLLRGQYYYLLAASQRGQRVASLVGADAFKAMANSLSKADADVDKALVENPHFAYGFLLSLKILGMNGPSQAFIDRFKQAAAAYPEFLPFYDVVLSRLLPKWGGNLQMMNAFVETYTAEAGQSPRQLLWLDLYRYMVTTGFDSCREQKGEAYGECLKAFMADNVKVDLQTKAVQALKYAGARNEFETNVAVSTIMADLIGQWRVDAFSGPMLQLAADSYHTDPRLRQASNDGNNYVIDTLVAVSWVQQGFYDNALSKLGEALQHIQTASFPSREQKDLATASLYEQSAKASMALGRYEDLIGAAQAALALNGRKFDLILVCFGHYITKDYDDAINECSSVVSDPESAIQAHYWRGLAYEEQHRDSDAIPDLTFVANSQDDRRVKSASDLAMIYLNRKDLTTALDVLNRYAFLYDTRVAAKDDVAVNFNNRCYAYMELGEFKKALDDCNASLENGSIPDAYKKKQELLAKIQ